MITLLMAPKPQGGATVGAHAPQLKPMPQGGTWAAINDGYVIHASCEAGLPRSLAHTHVLLECHLWLESQR